jgi:hypothetical protein
LKSFLRRYYAFALSADIRAGWPLRHYAADAIYAAILMIFYFIDTPLFIDYAYAFHDIIYVLLDIVSLPLSMLARWQPDAAISWLHYAMIRFRHEPRQPGYAFTMPPAASRHYEPLRHCHYAIIVTPASWLRCAIFSPLMPVFR